MTKRIKKIIDEQKRVNKKTLDGLLDSHDELQKKGATYTHDAWRMLIHLGHVEHMSIVGIRLRAKDIKYLCKECEELQSLALYDVKITDKAFKHIKKMKSLASLSLDNMDIADACLDHIIEIPGLRQLHIVRTWITLGGAKKAAEAIPECNFWYNEERM